MITNVLEYLEASAVSVPRQIAFSSEDSSLTYGELAGTVSRIGSFLSDRLHALREPVAVFMEKSPECLAAFFGIVASGNFYVCIDTKMAAGRIMKIFDTLRPAALLTDLDTELPFPAPCPVFSYAEASQAAINDEALSGIRRQCIDTDPVYVLYTSGSTGIPKGSVISHRSVIAYAEWLVETFHFDTNTVFGSQTPFFFSMSVLDIYACIKCGGALQIIPKKLFSFPISLLHYLNEKAVNTIYWVPSALSIVANWKALDHVSLPKLKTVLFAGEVMPTKQLNVWRAHLPDALFANLFGPTEITDIALYYILDRDFQDNEPIPIGYPCKNMDVLVLDEDGRKVADGEIGELYFRGSFVGEGYYRQSDKTKQAFVQNPLNDAYPEIVYRTGDLVKKNAYGEYLYAGRKDSQIKHMGYRIELGEIEAAAGAHEALTSCACLYDAARDKLLLFYTGNASEAQLREYLGLQLPAYMMPSEFIPLSVMPCNANGKTDRKLLQNKYILQNDSQP